MTILSCDKYFERVGQRFKISDYQMVSQTRAKDRDRKTWQQVCPTICILIHCFPYIYIPTPRWGSHFLSSITVQICYCWRSYDWSIGLRKNCSRISLEFLFIKYQQ